MRGVNDMDIAIIEKDIFDAPGWNKLEFDYRVIVMMLRISSAMTAAGTIYLSPGVLRSIGIAPDKVLTGLDEMHKHELLFFDPESMHLFFPTFFNTNRSGRGIWGSMVKQASDAEPEKVRDQVNKVLEKQKKKVEAAAVPTNIFAGQASNMMLSDCLLYFTLWVSKQTNSLGVFQVRNGFGVLAEHASIAEATIHDSLCRLEKRGLIIWDREYGEIFINRWFYVEHNLDNDACYKRACRDMNAMFSPVTRKAVFSNLKHKLPPVKLALIKKNKGKSCIYSIDSMSCSPSDQILSDLILSDPTTTPDRPPEQIESGPVLQPQNGCCWLSKELEEELENLLVEEALVRVNPPVGAPTKWAQARIKEAAQKQKMPRELELKLKQSRVRKQREAERAARLNFNPAAQQEAVSAQHEQPSESASTSIGIKDLISRTVVDNNSGSRYRVIVGSGGPGIKIGEDWLDIHSLVGLVNDGQFHVLQKEKEAA